MPPQAVIKRLTFIVIGFDTLGFIAAVALSYGLRGVFYDEPIWTACILSGMALGTAIGVWQAVKAMR